jgi:hypothetical protein
MRMPWRKNGGSQSHSGHATNLLVVVHTHVEIDDDRIHIRIVFPRESRRSGKSASMSTKADPTAGDMKNEYDFTGAARGKFYREGAELIPPVHLEPEVLNYLRARAEARGTSLNKLVNELLKKASS